MSGVEGAHFKLEGSGLHGKNTRVWLDGEEISAKVQQVDLQWAADKVNTVTVRFLVGKLEVDGNLLPVLVSRDADGNVVEARGFDRRRAPRPAPAPDAYDQAEAEEKAAGT